MKQTWIQEYFHFQEQITPDGSERLFLKGHYRGQPALLIKPGGSPGGVREGLAYASISRHLHAHQLPVPELYYFAPETGDVLTQYIEGRHLESEIKAYHDDAGRLTAHGEAAIKKRYETILNTLLKMQTQGAKGFDTGWCFDTPSYDSHLAFEREAMYFLNAFLKDIYCITAGREIEEELKEFCSQVDHMNNSFLLHRDFQSRNILVSGDRFWFLDFQGARLGPLGYDLASLLFDPYVDLAPALRAHLFRFYWTKLHETITHITFDDFQTGFNALAILRTMQAIGAYSFLSVRKGKTFFRRFIPIALRNLRLLLSETNDLSGLKQLIANLHDDKTI